MEELDIAQIKKKSIRGIVALTSRTFFLQIIAFAATFLLTIVLSPQIFGVFYVVSAIISFLGYFSDIGLAAALIQKKEALTPDDLATTFTIQQTLVILLCGITYFLSGWVGQFYGLDQSGVWLLRALIVSFFLSSLKTIPSVLLERKLEFKRLVVPQILETVAFYAVAVMLAWRGLGIQSFTWAVLSRGIVGLIAIYVVSPWRISVGISLPVAKRLLRFGVPFQMNSFLALLKDDLLTIVLGKILPFAHIGYIGWAKKWAEVPLRLIMDSVLRVTFPMYARLQKSRESLGTAIDSTLFALAVVLLPVSAFLMFFIGPVITFIPKYSKWEPALLSFYIFVVTAAIAAFSTTLTNALNAIGKIRITLYLMVLWTVLGWALTITLVHFMGFEGVAVALFIISWTIFLVVFLVKRYVPIHMTKALLIPLVGICVQSLWYASLRGSAPYSIVRLGVVAISGAILYGSIVWVFERERLGRLLKHFRT